jgi:hypothetical protein
MAHPFRYVYEDCLYLGFSQAMPLDDGRKVFGITCPDFVENYFEIIETGNPNSPYLPKTINYFNPFSEVVITWFNDDKLLFG